MGLMSLRDARYKGFGMWRGCLYVSLCTRVGLSRALSCGPQGCPDSLLPLLVPADSQGVTVHRA